MKLLVLTFLFLSFTGVSFSQVKKEVKKENVKKTKTKKEKKGPITFTTTEIVRMDIPYGTDDVFEFEFKNTGKTPLTIQNVKTSCGCTTASKPTEPVKPRKSAVISVKYDTKRVGNFSKTITITTDAQPEPILLIIKGKVLPKPSTETTTPTKEVKE